MIIPKQLKYIALIMLASGTIVLSCKKVTDEPKLTGIRLSAYLSNQDYNDFPLMGQKCDFGIYVTEEGTEKVVNDYSNLRFQTKFKAGIMQLTPSADFQFFYPEEEKMVDIAGYYPYNSELTADHPYYLVNLTDQNALEPEILLIAKASGSNSVLNKALLSLKSAYSKLNISVKLNENTPDATDMPVELVLDNVASCAELNILNGEYTSLSAESSVVLQESNSSAHSRSALVIPQVLAEDSELSVNYPESESVKSQSIRLKDFISSFEMNKQYDIDIFVSPQGVNAELVKVSELYISDWNEDSEIITDKI